jgi:two-component system, NtrC family, nitrogen regulation sensor histidine kinase NtrY
MARLPILNENEDPVPLGTLYIEFQSRYTPEEIGYPELLLDKVVSTRTDLSSYSYARYIKGRLVSHYGSYPYELNSNLFKNNSSGEFTFFEGDDDEHLIYRPSKDALVVLSRPIEGVLGILTPFSYLVLFFSFLVLIPSGMKEIRNGGYFAPISFKRRIQLSIVLLLFVSLILIGGGTIVYIISNSNEKNLKNISEKIHSLLIETEYLLAKDSQLYPQKAEDVAYSLTRQANVFFSDINIYDPSGYLYASSRPKIFEEGLVAKNMNPEALYGLAVRKSTEFTHEERIGNLDYVSSYVPLRNYENNVIGYLNLPYFARQNELRKEIATFVVAIVNIYVLLIVLVVITAIFLSNRVTAPLQLIREKLSGIRLGKKNEIIEWKGSDEIADLIGEYNRMVSELAESADRLARSERESAWREMAKQVAHEIKNPLTPMKLSTQLLKRAWDDKAPEFEQRIERFTNNLIEQIDTLSHIATEFSNFAKMPKMSPEKVDLSQLLRSTVDFHQGEDGVEISLNCKEDQSCWVYTDKEQLLRVFNNLIRNAIQAIPQEKQGKIDIRMRLEKNTYVVAIQDNGTGISDELKEKIFSPNFTTKNGGMGLGLALVKNIVESSSGQIWFESTIGEGTTFYIQLPVFDQEQRP